MAAADVTSAVQVRSFGELQAQLRALAYSEVRPLSPSGGAYKSHNVFFFIGLYYMVVLSVGGGWILQPVGADSVALVRRMLSDLVAANGAREKAEGALEKAQREALEFSQLLLPLRKENAQLTRENNSVRKPVYLWV